MKQSELLDSDLLFQYFGQIFSFFLSRLSKIEFPLEMNEKKIQAVLDHLNLISSYVEIPITHYPSLWDICKYFCNYFEVRELFKYYIKILWLEAATVSCGQMP